MSIETTNKLPEEGLVKLPAVEAFTSLKKSTIYKCVREGTFPAPVKVAGATLWNVKDLREWLESLGK